MMFSGKVFRDGSFWLAEVPVFEAMTQGRTRKEALEMIEDWFVSMVDRPGFSVTVDLTGSREFEVGSEDLRSMISLLLQRQRHRSGMSLAEAAEKLGAKSRNAYARYERGESVPTVEKLDELLHAVSADHGLVVGQSVARQVSADLRSRDRL
jgi:DNA-binding XRE family transcriptional regulator